MFETPDIAASDGDKIEGERVQTFAEQFAHLEKIKVAGGTAEVVDISPENPKDEVPIFFAPAWACEIPVYEEAFKKFFELKRRIVSINHPRTGGDTDKALEDLEIEMSENLPNAPEELKKALNILGVLDEKGIVRTDVVAHSEGALNAIFAATLDPKKFRDIVLFAPAGLIGEDKLLRLLKGFSEQGKEKETMKDIPDTLEKKTITGPRVIKSLLRYVTKNPVRSAKEVNDLTNTQIHELLRYLSDEGVNIVVMATADDPVFPMKDMQKIVKDDMIKGFLSMRGGHGEIGDHPELYVPAAMQMFDALNKKREKDAQGLTEDDSADIGPEET